MEHEGLTAARGGSSEAAEALSAGLAVSACARRGAGSDAGKRRKALEYKENPEASRTSGFLMSGAPAGIRTPDTLLKRQVLCRLSYWGVFNF